MTGSYNPARLERYRARRSPSGTPEPFGDDGSGGSGRAGRGRVFVVQKHAASTLHWDLRLEMGGVLASWAVPKGPSPNQADKRLAVHVEDHPLDYADFEGVIPKGSYGGGPMIVWDRGVWTPVGDPEDGMAKGKLLFDLKGYKLKGRWTLVRTRGRAAGRGSAGGGGRRGGGDGGADGRRTGRHWLLIKERDGEMDPDGGTHSYPDDSILSGLTVERLGEGGDFGAEVRKLCAEAGAPEGEVRAAKLKVMTAEARETAFDRTGWVFEIKYDGYRLVGETGGVGGRGPAAGGRAARGAGAGGSPEGGGAAPHAVQLVSRNGNDLTHVFPEVAQVLGRLPYRGAVIDGEVVVNDAEGLPSFALIQKRGRLQRAGDIARAAARLPATYYAFDLLGLEGRDLRGLPLLKRKDILRKILPTVGPVRYSDHIAERGQAMFETVRGLGLEGIVAKRADSVYVGGRSASWTKVRVVRSEDFAIHGFTEPEKGAAPFGALHLARWEDGAFVYAGRVGTGFTAALQDELGRELRGEDPSDPPQGHEAAGPGRHHWVRPRRVAEVSYREVTEAGLLRHPSLLRIRTDKDPEECRAERVRAGAEGRGGPGGVAGRARDDRGGAQDRGEAPRERHDRSFGMIAGPASAARTASAGGPRVVHFTNPDKPFWPEDGLVKGDLIEYYRAVAPVLLPYLADRPLVLTRFPDGIHGKSFFQKNTPEFIPDWVRRVRLYSGGSERDLDYIVADDLETLLHVANSASIPLHIWQSRVADLDRPDFCVLDLDPKDASFSDVVRIALFFRELCQLLDLPSFVKTSGSSGLHVLVPLGGQADYEQSRTIGNLLALMAVRELPDIATVARNPRRREGRVYVDFVQNGRGRLIAAPYCVRPRPGAPVSTPLDWSEVNGDLAILDHTVRNVPARVEARGDPMREVLTVRSDLAGSVARLGGMVG